MTVTHPTEKINDLSSRAIFGLLIATILSTLPTKKLPTKDKIENTFECLRCSWAFVVKNKKENGDNKKDTNKKDTNGIRLRIIVIK